MQSGGQVLHLEKSKAHLNTASSFYNRRITTNRDSSAPARLTLFQNHPLAPDRTIIRWPGTMPRASSPREVSKSGQSCRRVLPMEEKKRLRETGHKCLH